jgi:large subunit ribosomal protein L3
MVMLLGKKVGMTRLYDETGRIMPVTVIQLGPCDVTQVKTAETDGYNAVQLGYEEVKASSQKKPAVGHAKKANTSPKKFVKEMRLSGKAEEAYEPGRKITVTAFADVKYVDVTGTSKGKGFAGVMKRHGFKGFPGSHGTERKHRAPGSLSAFASNRGHGGGVRKGKRMAGHMGNNTVTTRNHKLVSIDEKKDLLVIKGAVAGPSGGYVVVRSSKKK